MKELIFYIIILTLLILMIPLYLTQGAVDIHLMDVMGEFARTNSESADWGAQIFWKVRLPRLVLSLVCGSGLALAGAFVQGIFRNPLVEPGLIGISSGAALFASFAIVVMEEWINQLFLLQIFSFLGALFTSILVYFLSRRSGKISVLTLLLMGIGINAGIGSLMGLMHYLASDSQLRAITFWGLGSLSGASWEVVLVIFPFVLLLYISIPILAKGLNAFLLGEKEAFHLGFNTERLKILVLLIVCLAIGAIVSVTGIIGFIGLVVPHIVRIWGRANHFFLLPASAILGGFLLLLSDFFARILVTPSELPIGILTAGIGAPLFIYILSRRIKEEG
ncbi:MAG: iron ABC transporter permease [Leptospira sp.]|nr:iron ABC transporter permease [Leptospira sp.]NCS92388.1 iron ABC transporter permease [Leptospira sp.]